MAETNENVVVRIADCDLTPVPALADEACKMVDDLVDQLMRAESDNERFWLCCSLSAAEQLAGCLDSHATNDVPRWRTPKRISLDFFGRIVSTVTGRPTLSSRYSTTDNDQAGKGA